MLKRLKVRYKLILLSAVIIILMVTFGLVVTTVIGKIKINGATYDSIIEQKDLVADILPPPEYILELHLTAYQILEETDTDQITSLQSYALDLEKVYNERHHVWVEALDATSDIGIALLSDSYKPVQKYFQVFNGDFMNAINANDKEKAKDILINTLVPLYQTHRSAIDEVVTLANEKSSTIEASSNTTIQKGIFLLVGIFTGMIIITLILEILISRGISLPLKFLQKHLGKMTNGDLRDTIPEKWLKSKDEIGIITGEINQMQLFLKEMMGAIRTESNHIHEVMDKCNENTAQITDSMISASETVDELSAGMQESAAATQEIGSISEQVKQVVEDIANHTREGAESAREISRKAQELKLSSIENKESAEEKSAQIKEDMGEALEQIKSVDRIKVLTDAVLGIVSETNLLALNAAIESARAGEAGKGFAVVASQIRKLAEDSERAVTEIQETVTVIIKAVAYLTNISKDTLTYIETNVMESYQDSVAVGENYGKDAEYVDGFVTEVYERTKELLISMDSIVSAIEGISIANNDGASQTVEFASQISVIKSSVDMVSDETEQLRGGIGNLSEMIARFQL